MSESSSQSKTEKATPKKIKDSAERGQSFKARDLIVACLTFVGVIWVVWFGSLGHIGEAYLRLVQANFDVNLHDYVISVLLGGVKTILPIVLLSIVATVIPSLLQSKFILATKALKLNFGALNPTKGFKKIFSLRSIKDTVKTSLYLSMFLLASWMTWLMDRGLIFSQLHATIPIVINIWARLILDLVLLSLACILIILILDALMELFLYLKELRMDKQELKREYKEVDGDPLIKSKRRQKHMELLSEQQRSDIRNANAIIVNPTHLAIGIYFRPEVIAVPFICVHETNQRALAVRRYAKTVGVPIIVDVPLARKLYQTHRLYEMVKLETIRPVLELLAWLKELELSDAQREELAAMRAQATPDNPATPDEAVSHAKRMAAAQAQKQIDKQAMELADVAFPKITKAKSTDS